MRITFNTLIIIITGILLFSCSKDDPDFADYSKIDGIVNNGEYYNAKIDSVYGIIYYDYNVIKSEIIAKSKFQNGKFYLNLPALTEDKLYCSIDTVFGKNVSISDRNVKVNFLYLRCMFMGYKNGDMFLNNGVNAPYNGYIKCEYIYCSNSVSVKGTTQKVDNLYTFTTNYNLTFKKGWNLMTSSFSVLNFSRETNVTSNELPSGVIWYPLIQTIRGSIRQK